MSTPSSMAPNSAAPPESFIKHWMPAFVLMVCVVLAFFDKISIAVLFADPHFQTAMGIVESKAKLGWLMTSFLLAYGFSCMFLSFLGDLINPKKLIFWSVASWGVLMFMMGFTTTYSGMVVMRILLGIAEGPLFALCYSIVKQRYSDREQARASTMFLLGTPIGATLGFPITAHVLASHDWHTTFFVMAALTVLVLFLVYFGLKDVQMVKADGSNKISKAQHRINLSVLFGNRAFWLVCIFNIAMMGYLWGLNSWIPIYLMEAKGFNLKEFGNLSMIPFIAMLVGEIFGAYYSDKIGKLRSPQVFIGLFLAGVGMYALVLSQGITQVILAMSFSSMLWGFAASAIFALLARVSTKEVASTAGGIFNGLGNFASALAPVIIGYIVQASKNFNDGVTFLAILAVVGSLTLIPLLKKH